MTSSRDRPPTRDRRRRRVFGAPPCEHGGEEGFCTAADALHTARVRLDPAIRDGPILERHGGPASAIIEHVQERLCASPATDSDDDLRAVAAPFVRPGQVLQALRQIDVLVVREAAGCRHRGTTLKAEIWHEIVHDRALAAAVRARDGDQFCTVGKALQVKRDLVETQAVADAAEALEGESEWLHGMPRSWSPIRLAWPATLSTVVSRDRSHAWPQGGDAPRSSLFKSS